MRKFDSFYSCYKLNTLIRSLQLHVLKKSLSRRTLWWNFRRNFKRLRWHKFRKFLLFRKKKLSYILYNLQNICVFKKLSLLNSEDWLNIPSVSLKILLLATIFKSSIERNFLYFRFFYEISILRFENFKFLLSIKSVDKFHLLNILSTPPKTFIINDFYPLDYENKQIKKTKYFVSASSYLPYVTHIISKYTSFLSRSPVLFFFTSNSLNFLHTKQLLLIFVFFNQNRFRRLPFATAFRPLDFFGLLLFSVYWLDFTWILRRLQLILDNINIFKHRKFWTYFFRLLYRNVYLPLSSSRVLGICVSIKGKVGVVGNSRKRRLFVRYGRPSVSNFTKKIYTKKSQFVTATGAIGFRIWILNY